MRNRKSILLQRGVAQPGSAPGLGPGGRRFESCRPDQWQRQVSENKTLAFAVYPRPPTAGLAATPQTHRRCGAIAVRPRRKRNAKNPSPQREKPVIKTQQSRRRHAATARLQGRRRATRPPHRRHGCGTAVLNKPFITNNKS